MSICDLPHSSDFKKNKVKKKLGRPPIEPANLRTCMTVRIPRFKQTKALKYAARNKKTLTQVIEEMIDSLVLND